MSAMDEIGQKLTGTWELDRSENFDDFMKEMGVNFVARKVASGFKPVLQFAVDGEYFVETRTRPVGQSVVTKQKLDTEQETEENGNKYKSIMTWSDGKMTLNMTPTDPKRKKMDITREIDDEGHLVQNVTVNNVTCKRIFKKK